MSERKIVQLEQQLKGGLGLGGMGLLLEMLDFD